MNVLAEYEFLEDFLKKRDLADLLHSLRRNDPEDDRARKIHMELVYEDFSVEDYQNMCHWLLTAVGLSIEALLSVDKSRAMRYLVEAEFRCEQLLRERSREYVEIGEMIDEMRKTHV